MDDNSQEECKMKLFKRVAEAVAIIGMATACGHYDINDPVTKVVDDEAANEAQQDDQLLALSLPIAGKSSQGVIVVERGVFVEKASKVKSNPPPPASKCFLHATSHLITIEASGEKLQDGSESSSFSATVSYPKTVKFPLSKSSCAEGQRIVVRQGHKFQGLAITRNRAGTEFLLLGKSNPGPLGVCSLIGPNPKCLPTPKDGSSCSVHAGRQNVRISDDGQQLKGTVVAASAILSSDRIIGECEIKSELKLKGSSLAKALSTGGSISPLLGGDSLPGTSRKVTEDATTTAVAAPQTSGTSSLK